MNHYLIVYDIPATCRVKNPSDQFRGHGVRINYSCWIVPEGRVAMLPLDQMQQGGAKVQVVRFDSSETDTLLRMAKTALFDEAARLRNALEHTVSEAKKRFSKHVEVFNEDEYKRSGTYASIHMRRVAEAIKSAEQCALAFDLTGDMAEILDGLRKTYAAMQHEVHSEYVAVKRKVNERLDSNANNTEA